MSKLHTGAALLLVALLGTVGCSVGTKTSGDASTATNQSPATSPTTPASPTSGTDTPASVTSGPNTPSSSTTTGAAAPNSALLLVMDASGSMNNQDGNGTPRIDDAKAALHKVVDGLPAGLDTGLRVFGARYPSSDRTHGCRDSQLIAPVKPLNRTALDTAIDAYAAKGYTPIGYSLQQAAKDLPTEGKRTILLVSDGEDTCGTPDPCQVATSLRGNGVDVVIDTVGVALGTNTTARNQLTCIARNGGGQFTDVANAGDLADTLPQVSTRATRRFQPTGTVLTGAPIPPQANDGQLGTQYTDTVKFHEVNYYRFPVASGSKIEATVYLAGNPAAADKFMCIQPDLVDDGDSDYGFGTMRIDDGDQNQTSKVGPVTVTADEVWLKIESGCATGPDDPSLDFHIQFKVDTVS